jgi:outer membrane receptor for ferric coprogen and ferric-rhodotorulic acid
MISLLKLLPAAGAAAACGILAASGQTARPPPPAPAVPAAAEAAVQLSVFEVTADKDLGYAASSALTGTRTNEKLENLPNSISVMTQEFLQDVAVNNFLDAVEFAANAENLYNDSGTRGAALGQRSGNQISFRGLASIRQLRDGFPWYMPQDIYNTERIEFSRGPGGLAYGDVDVGGIINISTKRAHARRQSRAQVRLDNWGSQRASLDLNQPLGQSGVAVRINAIQAENESWRQRSGTDLRGYAGAVRWEPCKHRRTLLDFTYEHGDQDEGFSHVVLDDQTAAYVRGTGTVALDSDPVRAGVQTNGVGMQQMRPATGAARVFGLIDGRIYNLQSTPTAVFRSSQVQIGATVAAGTDPVNPLRFPIIGVSEQIVPRGQDWGGPINKLNSKFHAYTLTLQHRFSDRLSLLFALNGQKDDTHRINVFNGNVAGIGVRDVLIDVNPSLPDPSDPTGTRLIRNPRFEQHYVVHNPVTIIDGHDIRNFRGIAVYDAALPWRIQQRLVFSAGYRHETYSKGTFTRALSREEILRRGYTGAAATFPNNLFYYYHYLNDGNSDAALANDHLPGVTTDFRHTNGGGSERYDQSLTSGSCSALGSYCGGRVRSSVGISRDHWLQSAFRPLVADPVTGEQRFVDLAGNLLPNRGLSPVDAPLVFAADQWVTNQTYGVVWHVAPWVSLTGGYFESALFSDNTGLDLNNRALAPKTGEGTDYSVRFALFEQRVNLNLIYFANTAENISGNVDATVRTELLPLLSTPFVNRTDYRDRETTGIEVELVTNLTRNWTVRGSFGRNEVSFTRYYPLLREKLAEARATARTRGLDPETATVVTRQYLADQEAADTSTGRKTANLTTRYSFTSGRLRGLAIGGSVRHIFGKDRAAIEVGGQQVLPKTVTEDQLVVSPFVSYRRKWRNFQWSAQLNVNNLFDKVTDQGTAWRYTRWTDPRQIIATVNATF